MDSCERQSFRISVILHHRSYLLASYPASGRRKQDFVLLSIPAASRPSFDHSQRWCQSIGLVEVREMVGGGEHGSVKTLDPWRAVYNDNRIFKNHGMVGSFRVSTRYVPQIRRWIELTSGWKAMAMKR
jgi:hypothetical protein